MVRHIFRLGGENAVKERPPIALEARLRSDSGRPLTGGTCPCLDPGLSVRDDHYDP